MKKRLPCSTSKIIWQYLDSLDHNLLSSKRADKERGINHCVYEKRISDKLECGESLEGLIKGTGELPSEGIIVIDAPADGYAKNFFAYRLFILCFDFLMEHQEYVRNFKYIQEVEWKLRIPIEVRKDAICCENGKGSLEKLAYICAYSVKSWLEEKEQFTWSNTKFTFLRKFMERELKRGHIFLLLPRGSLEMSAEFARMLEEVLGSGKQWGNMAVYVAEDGSFFETELYCIEARYSVRLGLLSEAEILDHIRFVSLTDKEVCTNFEKLVKKNEVINKELKMPERLLLFSGFFGKTVLKNVNVQDKLKRLGSVAQLYKAIVDASIDDCIKKIYRFQVPKSAKKVISDTLRALAWKKMTGSQEENIDIAGSADKRFLDCLAKATRDKLGNNFAIWELLTQQKDFLVNADTSFCFQGCVYYFVAEKLYLSMQNEETNILDQLCNPVFLEKTNSQMYLFLADMIKDHAKEKGNKEEESFIKQKLDVIWSSIIDNRMAGENNRVQVLVDILERFEMMHAVTYNGRLIEFILKELSSQYYDSNLFDTIQKVNEKYSNLRINDCLKERYADLRKHPGELPEFIDNKKRRLSYYFGKVKCGIPDEVIEDLLDSNVHVHVKYHAILAIVENYGEHKTNDLLSKYDEELMSRAREWEADAILYSDYLILRAKKSNVDLGHGEKEFQLQIRLFGLLNASEYWKRAHAAGALGRLGLYDSADKLLDQIKTEMKQIKTDENSLKAVSYITEAICELFYQQNKDIAKNESGQDKRQVYEEGVRKYILEFTNLMTFDFHAEELQSDVNDMLRRFVASATIGEGILYLNKAVRTRKPQDIGKHIKHGMKDMKGNFLVIQEVGKVVKDRFVGNANLVETVEQFQDDAFDLINNMQGQYKVDGQKPERRMRSKETEKAGDVNNYEPIQNQINIQIVHQEK